MQVEQVGTWSKVSLTVLHDLDSERDLQHAVDQFFETAEQGSVLLVQCDPRAASLRYESLSLAQPRHPCELFRMLFSLSVLHLCPTVSLESSFSFSRVRKPGHIRTFDRAFLFYFFLFECVV